jgi:hypothetical protein
MCTLQVYVCYLYLVPVRYQGAYATSKRYSEVRMHVCRCPEFLFSLPTHILLLVHILPSRELSSLLQTSEVGTK